MDCILCQNQNTAVINVTKKPEHTYHMCSECDLIFMAPLERLSAREEMDRYNLHQNQGSAGHLAFLEPLIKDVNDYFKSANVDLSTLSALDFGCGPTPSLSSVLSMKGYKTFDYDLYYHPDQEAFRRNYHLITATEVFEHFQQPRVEIDKLVRLLKSGGLLAVMTSAHKGEAAFHDWHYRRDETHVTFYSEKTMEWIAHHYHLNILKAKSPYWIFQKPLT